VNPPDTLPAEGQGSGPGTGPGLSVLLDRVAALKGPRVSIGDVVAEVGDTAFTPLILLAALIIVSPLSGIPGLPSLFGALMMLISGQMLAGRRNLWLPGLLRRRAIPAERLRRALGRLRRVAAALDRRLHPRLTVLTDGMAGRVPVVMIFATGCGLPLLEVFPFVSSLVAFAIAVLAAGLFARDGLLVIAGYCIYAIWAGAIVWLVGLLD